MCAPVLSASASTADGPEAAARISIYRLRGRFHVGVARVVALRQIRSRAVSLVSPCGATHVCACQNCVKRANCLLLSKLARAFKLITWTNWIVRSSSACCSSVFSRFSLFSVLSVPLSLFPRHYHQCFVVLCGGVRDLQSKRSTHVHNVRHEARAASRAWLVLPPSSLPPYLPPSLPLSLAWRNGSKRKLTWQTKTVAVTKRSKETCKWRRCIDITTCHIHTCKLAHTHTHITTHDLK